MDFDPMLWRIIVEKVLVGTDGTVTFTMVDGKEYRIHFSVSFRLLRLLLPDFCPGLLIF